MELTLIEFGQRMLILFGILAVLDFGLAYHTKARWFLLHGIFNMIIGVTCLPMMYMTYLNPERSLASDGEIWSVSWPILQVGALHLWHMIAYSGLTWDDWFHHLTFAGVLCSTALFWSWGNLGATFCFYICGVPGGLDYLFLAAVKHNWITKLDEKRWNAYINTWIRAPGIITCVAMMYCSWMSSTGVGNHVPALVKALAIALGILNAQYYSRRVVASWARWELAEADSKVDKKNTTAKENIRRSKGSVIFKGSSLDGALQAKGWPSLAFSPTTRETIAESASAYSPVKQKRK